jgi:hypothetical protein
MKKKYAGSVFSSEYVDTPISDTELTSRIVDDGTVHIRITIKVPMDIFFMWQKYPSDTVYLLMADYINPNFVYSGIEYTIIGVTEEEFVIEIFGHHPQPSDIASYEEKIIAGGDWDDGEDEDEPDYFDEPEIIYDPVDMDALAKVIEENIPPATIEPGGVTYSMDTSWTKPGTYSSFWNDYVHEKTIWNKNN